MESLIIPSDTFIHINLLFDAISTKDTPLCLQLLDTIDKSELSTVNNNN